MITFTVSGTHLLKMIKLQSGGTLKYPIQQTDQNIFRKYRTLQYLYALFFTNYSYVFMTWNTLTCIFLGAQEMKLVAKNIIFSFKKLVRLKEKALYMLYIFFIELENKLPKKGNPQIKKLNSYKYKSQKMPQMGISSDTMGVLTFVGNA